MQTRPDHPTLLEAVARFLLEEVSPKLDAEKALQFRILIAANLTQIVANERRTEEARLGAETSRLHALLRGVSGDLETLNRVLSQKLRAGELDSKAALEHLLATAKETLAVTNPRFAVSDEV